MKEYINIKFKHLLHRNYWWVSTLLVIGIFILFIFIEEVEIELFISSLGAVFTSIYFVQKQKLEESKLFKELFGHFNKEYGKLNDKLEDFIQYEQDGFSDTKELRKNPEYYDLLINYFNLCAEEYVYYQQGYIYPNVWESWKNGMKYYCKKSTLFMDLWEEELGQGSYYKFNLEQLEIEDQSKKTSDSHKENSV
jgi:hypothetical protein